MCVAGVCNAPGQCCVQLANVCVAQ
jgi:hypothetical protein